MNVHYTNKEDRERSIENYFKREVKKAGGITYKWTSTSHRGVLDQITVFPGGHVYFIEIKRPTGTVSRLQRKVINDLKQMGCEVYVLYDREDVDAFCRDSTKIK